MAGTDGLRSLVAAELGECRDDDVERRRAELESLPPRLPERPDADLDALTAFETEIRYSIAGFLAAAEEELCVCEFAPLLDVSESAISHALTDLTDAGLVTRRKEGTWRYYRSTERADALLAALDATRGVVE